MNRTKQVSGISLVLSLLMLCMTLFSSTAFANDNFQAPAVNYKYSKSVKAGSIRYVSQKPSSKLYQKKYWGKYAGNRTKWYCKSADVSMMLSYLGINKLPKDIIANTGDNKCMTKSFGKAIKDVDVDFYQAMDNYLNGNGLYSPPMVRLTNSCFKKSGQHFVVAIDKVDDTHFVILDPYRDTTYVMETSGKKIKSFTWGKKTYTSKLTNVYQYHLKQDTSLVNEIIPETLQNEGTTLDIGGHLFGSEKIKGVEVGCVDATGTKQNDCYVSENVNSVGFNLSRINSKLHFENLLPNKYIYLVKANIGSETKTLLKKEFSVSPKQTDISTICASISPVGKSKLFIESNGLIKNNPSKIIIQEYNGTGYYKISNDRGQVLSYDAAKKNLIFEKESKSADQLWIVSKNEDKSYSFAPKDNPYMQAALTDNRQASLVQRSNDASQNWNVIPYDIDLSCMLENKTLKLSWKDIPCLSSYDIYRSESDGKWEKAATINDRKTTSWIDDIGQNNCKYSYMIKCVYGAENTMKESPGSNKVSCIIVSKPSITKLKYKKNRKVCVEWDKEKGDISGYELQYSKGRTFSKRNVTSVIINNPEQTSKTLSKLPKYRWIRFRVRSFSSVNNKKIYSNWSKVKAVKVYK